MKIKENKKIWISGGIIVLTITLVLSIFIFSIKTTPTLKLKVSSEKISSNYKEEIIIPAVLSKLPDNEYPAASVEIKFDNNKLEFVGISIGTMETYNDYDPERDDEASYKIPQWSYNEEVANQEGVIKAMYLDTTAGKNAYVSSGFEKEKKDIPFQLIFKLKDSVIPNDELVIEIEEAVFATINGDVDKTTLSTKDSYGKLKVRDGIIRITS
ncbi:MULTISPECIES: hypothetical protein [unclassified Clostridium]|uniref:hypothetical protein n=1 Tax=unclassified Clostridium TaxID=2614128 RepID=UPI001C8B253D|nr:MULTISPECIES: hypothetical protein [unclassified Clostridium]MBX9138616.1 hypothetical protein [Clostridium sp. K12(2020)]MBX9145376.1 hypothetical protein [Clostridium sp. K13]MDU4324932.1 hypothetical protein [Clostridium celatum]